MRNFRKLKVWQQAKKISVEAYVITSKLEKQDQYVFSSQIRRAAVSIASNIAEGSSRRSSVDNARFIEIAIGSAFELETQLIILQELDIASPKIDKLLEMLEEEQKMLFGYLRSLRETPPSFKQVKEALEIYS